MAKDADQAFSAGCYGEALALYEAHAAGGDPYAGEMAGYMLYFGPALFGAGVPCDRARARRWLTVAAGRGRLVAQMMVRRIDGCAAEPPRATSSSLPCSSSTLQ